MQLADKGSMASTRPEVPGFCLLLTSSQTSLVPESEVVRAVTGPSHSSPAVALGFSALGKKAGRSREGISFDSPPGPSPGRNRAGVPHVPWECGHLIGGGVAQNLLLAGPVAWGALL